MPLSQSELLDLIDDVNVMVAQVIASFAELNESMVDDVATATAKERVAKLKQKTDHAKQQLADLRDRQRHRQEIERRRKENERERNKTAKNEGRNGGMVTLRAASGRVIGYMRVMGPNQTDFYDRTGKLVAREIGNLTYDGRGRVAFRGRLGLVVVGADTRLAE
jgi:hypothetical protein